MRHPERATTLVGSDMRSILPAVGEARNAEPSLAHDPRAVRFRHEMSPSDFSIPLAVEKVLFRLAVLEGGRVAIARAFVELPLSLEELEKQADKAVDGRVLLKDDFGEVLAYELPEVKSGGTAPAPPDDCPMCGGARRGAQTAEGGAPPERPLLCDGCYRAVWRGLRSHRESTLSKLKSFWKAPPEPPEKVAAVEHEIFHVALRLGAGDPSGPGVTHTTIAAQSRLSAAVVKDCLERFQLRRYVRFEVSDSGTFVYRFPQGLVYSESQFRRFRDDDSGRVVLEPRPAPTSEPPAKPGEPAKDLKIVVKDKRQRPGRGPAGR
jgi:hypothetical protein